VVTLSRFFLAAAVAAVALGDATPRRAALVTLFAAAVLTDVADGWWARHAGITSDKGAKLDSAADAALSAAVVVALVATVRGPMMPWVWWAIGATGAVRVAGLCVTFMRFRVVSIAHTWGNKAAGAALAAVVTWVLGSGRLDSWPVAVGCVVAGAAAIEEAAMAATARAYDRDRKGWWAAAPPRTH
jgi:CDP-diacylglycerol--glycerol-3-phosphate 3-phosphatidyltransferase